MKIQGLRFKVRTEERDGHAVIVYTLWLGRDKKAELGTLRLDVAEAAGGAGSPLYQGWYEAMRRLAAQWISAIAKNRIDLKRQAPDYRGEGEIDA